MIEIFYRRWNNSIHKSSFMIILTFLLELYKSNNIYHPSPKKGEGFHFLTSCNDISFALSEKWFSQLYRFHFFPSCKFTLLKEQKRLFKTKVNWSKSCHVWCLKCSHITNKPTRAINTVKQHVTLKDTEVYKSLETSAQLCFQKLDKLKLPLFTGSTRNSVSHEHGVLGRLFIFLVLFPIY